MNGRVVLWRPLERLKYIDDVVIIIVDKCPAEYESFPVDATAVE